MIGVRRPISHRHNFADRSLARSTDESYARISSIYFYGDAFTAVEKYLLKYLFHVDWNYGEMCVCVCH